MHNNIDVRHYDLRKKLTTLVINKACRPLKDFKSFKEIDTVTFVHTLFKMMGL